MDKRKEFMKKVLDEIDKTEKKYDGRDWTIGLIVAKDIIKRVDREVYNAGN